MGGSSMVDQYPASQQVVNSSGLQLLDSTKNSSVLMPPASYAAQTAQGFNGLHSENTHYSQMDAAAITSQSMINVSNQPPG